MYIKGVRITYKEVQNYFLEENHTLLTTENEFVSTSQTLKIKCNICGAHEETQLRHFKKRVRYKCRKCYEQNRLKEVESLIKTRGYTLLSTNFVSTKHKLTIQCDKGHIWNPNYDSIVKGSQCLRCRDIEVARKQRVASDEFYSRFEAYGYTLLTPYEEYENTEQKLTVRCPKGHTYQVSLSNWTNGKRCPKCKESRGELYISEFLKSRGICFERQKRFKECTYKNTLPFDFYIESLKTVIEYDGEQHFKQGRFGMSDEEFLGLKKRDEIKTQFCKDNGIKIIRIPYYEFDNIDNILDELLEETSTTISEESRS